MTLAPAPPVRANDRQPLRPDSEEIATLIKRGKDLLDNGDLSAARLLFRRAAEAGSAEGALMLGSTFDPGQWYQRAAELGSSAASQQLAGLADGR